MKWILAKKPDAVPTWEVKGRWAFPKQPWPWLLVRAAGLVPANIVQDGQISLERHVRL